MTFSPWATAASVSVDVNATAPGVSKSDGDMKSSILLLITTSRKVSTDCSSAEASASIFTLFFSSASATGDATGAGCTYQATGSTFYHGELQDYKHAWGPKSLNVVLPPALLDFSGTGISSYAFSFFQTASPQNIFLGGSVSDSQAGLTASGALSLADFVPTTNGSLLTKANILIDDSSIPSDTDLTFANVWEAAGSGLGSASVKSAVRVHEPLSSVLLGSALAGLIMLKIRRRLTTKRSASGSSYQHNRGKT
jgi:hypothetical protein